jgi:EmrB/QacA subfamily drug resistance transporter
MSTSPHGGPPVRRSGALVAVAVLAAFTANIDLNIVNLALPRIGQAFGVGQSELAWAVNAYVLPYAVSILAVGRLGDGLGHRRVLGAGAAIFAVGSLVAAAAPAYPILLVARAIQGFGGSALLTIGLAIVSANFDGPARGRALGLYFAAGATAATVGPLVGGVLTSIGGWPAIFWTQIPLACAVVVAAMTILPERAPGRRRSLDVPGLLAGSVILLGINVALLQAHSWGWGSPAIVASWLVAVIALLAFVARERVASEPAIRLAVFRSRVFVASAIVGAAAWFGILSGTVQLSIYLQAVRGLDVFGAALVLTPWPLLAGFLFPRSGAIVARIGPERAMVGSVATAMVAAVAMTFFDTGTPFVIVSLVTAIGGVPIALGVTASTVCALAEFEPSEAGIAAGVFNSLRQVGSSLGVAIPAAVSELAAGAAAAGAGSGISTMAGSNAALASRAVIFLIALVAVWVLLPRDHRVVLPVPTP